MESPLNKVCEGVKGPRPAKTHTHTQPHSHAGRVAIYRRRAVSRILRGAIDMQFVGARAAAEFSGKRCRRSGHSLSIPLRSPRLVCGGGSKAGHVARGRWAVRELAGQQNQNAQKPRITATQLSGAAARSNYRLFLSLSLSSFLVLDPLSALPSSSSSSSSSLPNLGALVGETVCRNFSPGIRSNPSVSRGRLLVAPARGSDAPRLSPRRRREWPSLPTCLLVSPLPGAGLVGFLLRLASRVSALSFFRRAAVCAGGRENSGGEWRWGFRRWV